VLVLAKWPRSGNPFPTKPMYTLIELILNERLKAILDSQNKNNPHSIEMKQHAESSPERMETMVDTLAFRLFSSLAALNIFDLDLKTISGTDSVLRNADVGHLLELRERLATVEREKDATTELLTRSIKWLDRLIDRKEMILPSFWDNDTDPKPLRNDIRKYLMNQINTP
jgi:ribosome assembly protein YihI (activator of Der GTPase)